MSNLRRHAVSFTEAASAFGDPLSVTIDDPQHSVGEHRCVLIGRTSMGRLVVVVHADRGNGAAEQHTQRSADNPPCASCRRALVLALEA